MARNHTNIKKSNNILAQGALVELKTFFIVFQMRVIRQDGAENRILWKLAYKQDHSFSTKTHSVYPHPIFLIFCSHPDISVLSVLSV